MPKGHKTGNTCRRCGVSESEGATISLGRYCVPCGQEAYLETVDQLRERSGPKYERWLAGQIEALRKLGAPGVVGR